MKEVLIELAGKTAITTTAMILIFLACSSITSVSMAIFACLLILLLAIYTVALQWDLGKRNIKAGFKTDPRIGKKK